MADVDEDIVDIDRLVDHYLGVSAPSLQNSAAASSDGDNDNDTPQFKKEEVSLQFSGSGEGKNKDYPCAFVSGSDDDNAVGGGANKKEEDIEAIVETILQEERHSESVDALVNSAQKEAGENEQSPHIVAAYAGEHLRSSALSASLRRADGDVGGGGRVLRRLMLWEERREAKRLQAVYEALLQEQVECTFQPLNCDQIGSKGNKSESPAKCDFYSRVEDVNGVEGFLQRMREARNARERKLRAMEEQTSRYRDHSRRNHRITIPKPFVLGTRSRKAAHVAANMDTFRKYGACVRSKLDDEPLEICGPSVPSGLFSLQSSELFLRHVANRTQ